MRATECNDLHAVKNIFIGRRMVELSLSSLLRASEHFAVPHRTKLRDIEKKIVILPHGRALPAKQQRRSKSVD